MSTEYALNHVIMLDDARETKKDIADIGDLLIAYLDMIGVDYVFGIPGGSIQPLYSALARSERRGGIRSIVARHESGAAFMADAYAKQTGKLGVCCSTTGPGATNLITGVSSAYADYSPMLVITAQTAMPTFGRGAFQESTDTAINTVGMFQYCTRYNSLISHVDQFEPKLVTAILSAFQSPAGPSHISVPFDIMRAPSSVASPTYHINKILDRPSLSDNVAVEALYTALVTAKRVVFVIGNGCWEAINPILQIADKLDILVVSTPHGKGLINPHHPRYRGVIGFAGHSSAKNLLDDPELDTLVAIGTTLGEMSTGGWDSKNILNDRLIHVEEAERNLTRSPMAKLHVRGRILTIFESIICLLNEEITNRVREPEKTSSTEESVFKQRHFQLDDEAKFLSDSAPIKPQRLMGLLAELAPPNTRYVADTGAGFAWAIHYLHPFDRRIGERRAPERTEDGRRKVHGPVFRVSLEFASMGWAIGAAVGTALACPGSPVVCITGDASYLMNGQEITVALQERLPVIFIVLNDAALGMIKHGQRLSGAEPIGFELPRIDYAKIARALGVHSHIIYSPQDLKNLESERIFSREGPTLLDVRIDPEEAPPIGMRIDALTK